MKRKSLVGLFIVIGLAGLVLIGASVDFAGDLVVREAGKTVKELMGAAFGGSVVQYSATTIPSLCSSSSSIWSRLAAVHKMRPMGGFSSAWRSCRSSHFREKFICPW